MVSWFSVHDATFSPKMFVCSFIPLSTFLQGFFLMVRHKADILYTPNRFCPVKKLFSWFLWSSSLCVIIFFMMLLLCACVPFPVLFSIVLLIQNCSLPLLSFYCGFISSSWQLLPRPIDSCCLSFLTADVSFLTAAASPYWQLPSLHPDFSIPSILTAAVFPYWQLLPLLTDSCCLFLLTAVAFSYWQLLYNLHESCCLSFLTAAV